ncbi:MAG: phage tail protein [Alphaproteobacteria bacterium]|nr:phage tail protein [Alphaproteobacteria bacterium]
MPPPIARTARVDPYKNFKFRVVFDGRAVAGFDKAVGLPATAQSGNAPPVMLYHGVTRDTAFEKWIGALHAARRYQRKDIAIVLQDEAGRGVKRYKLHHAWVSKYQGMPNLDANANEVAIESLSLMNEGIEID